MHDWYHRLANLFELDCDRWRAVDETKLDIEDEGVYGWAAVEVETFEVLHVEVSPGRANLDGSLWFGPLNYRTRLSRRRIPHYSTRESTER